MLPSSHGRLHNELIPQGGGGGEGRGGYGTRNVLTVSAKSISHAPANNILLSLSLSLSLFAPPGEWMWLWSLDNYRIGFLLSLCVHYVYFIPPKNYIGNLGRFVIIIIIMNILGA